MKKNKNIVFAAIFAGVIVICAMFLIFRQGKVAKIYCDGQCVASVDLDKVSESREIKVGEGNVVLVEKGKISMKSADCPDKLCVKQGKISTGSIPIVCLPNKIVIRIEDREYDAVVIN